MSSRPMDPIKGEAEIQAAVQQWLKQVVIGLNLCPFALEPERHQQIRIQVSDARHETALLTALEAELKHLDTVPADELQTTLLVTPTLLSDFSQYNQFLQIVETFLIETGWEETYQVASFHPHYQFAGTLPDDAENLTNRSPYPILHILREDSIDVALENYANPEQIPERNIRKMQGLSPMQKKQLFPYVD